MPKETPVKKEKKEKPVKKVVVKKKEKVVKKGKLPINNFIQITCPTCGK